MICKYFNKGKGSKGVVEYLLNEREREGTAYVIRGNAETTRTLIKNNTNKHKYSSGVLSFEEKDISEIDKQEIMDLFEKSTFAGLEKDQYNILWVVHQDKERLELNFVIPRLEMYGGKAFNPHWHSQDQTRLLKFQDFVNSKYKFSNPFAANKRQTLTLNTNWKNKNSFKEEFHAIIEHEVEEGNIENRTDVINFIKENGFKISRENYDHLTIIYGDKKTDRAKMKGTYYGKNFTSLEAIEAEINRTEREHIKVTPGELRELEQELDRLIRHKAKTTRERYRVPEATERSNKIETNSNTRGNGNIIETRTERDRDRVGSYDKREEEKERNSTLVETLENDKKGGKINDRDREVIENSSRERERSRERAREREKALFNSFKTNGRELHQGNENDKGGISQVYEKFVRRYGEFRKSIKGEEHGIENDKGLFQGIREKIVKKIHELSNRIVLPKPRASSIANGFKIKR